MVPGEVHLIGFAELRAVVRLHRENDVGTKLLVSHCKDIVDDRVRGNLWLGTALITWDPVFFPGSV